MEAPKGGLESERDGSGKEGEPKASGAERVGNRDPTAITVNHSKARRTRQVVDTGPALTNFTGETALSRSFGRSEGNGTSQLLVKAT